MRPRTCWIGRGTALGADAEEEAPSIFQVLPFQYDGGFRPPSIRGCIRRRLYPVCSLSWMLKRSRRVECRCQAGVFGGFSILLRASFSALCFRLPLLSVDRLEGLVH